MVRWALMLRHGEPNIIIAVVDDSEDDELAATVAREDHVPSEHFGGLWGKGQKDGNWLAAFRMISSGVDSNVSGGRRTSSYELLETILEVPRYVAVMAAEIAGDTTTPEAMIRRLGGALIVAVEHRSPEVEAILAERDEMR